MKDIDQLIEQVHAENRKRLEQEALRQGEMELRLGEQELRSGQKELWQNAKNQRLGEQELQSGQKELWQNAKNQRLGEQDARLEGGKHLWRYAAAVALVVGVAAVLLLPMRQEQQKARLAQTDVPGTARKMPQIAKADVPQPVRQQLEKAKQKDASAQPMTSQTNYAYSETDEGVRVYCNDGCDANEVLERMQRVMETLE